MGMREALPKDAYFDDDLFFEVGPVKESSTKQFAKYVSYRSPPTTRPWW